MVVCFRTYYSLFVTLSSILESRGQFTLPLDKNTEYFGCKMVVATSSSSDWICAKTERLQTQQA